MKIKLQNPQGIGGNELDVILLAKPNKKWLSTGIQYFGLARYGSAGETARFHISKDNNVLIRNFMDSQEVERARNGHFCAGKCCKAEITDLLPNFSAKVSYSPHMVDER